MFAALDLFTEDPELSGQVDLDEVAGRIGPSTGVLLDVSLRPVHEATADALVPEWYEDATSRRFDVWVAVGIVMARHHKPAVDALSMLRGYAYSHDRSLDDVVLDRLQLRWRGVLPSGPRRAVGCGGVGRRVVARNLPLVGSR